MSENQTQNSEARNDEPLSLIREVEYIAGQLDVLQFDMLKRFVRIEQRLGRIERDLRLEHVEREWQLERDEYLLPPETAANYRKCGN